MFLDLPPLEVVLVSSAHWHKVCFWIFRPWRLFQYLPPIGFVPDLHLLEVVPVSFAHRVCFRIFLSRRLFLYLLPIGFVSGSSALGDCSSIFRPESLFPDLRLLEVVPVSSAHRVCFWIFLSWRLFQYLPPIGFVSGSSSLGDCSNIFRP